MISRNLRKNIDTYTDNIISICFLLALLGVIFFTFFSYRARFQSDSAIPAMLYLQQISGKTLILNDWYYSQDFWPFFIFNPVLLFFPIVKDAYIATQLGVFFQSLIIGVLALVLLKKQYKTKLNLLVVIFIFSGVSTIWSEFFLGQGQYGNVVMWILMCLIFSIKALSEKNERISFFFHLAVGLLLVYLNSTGVRYLPLFSGASLLALLIIWLMPSMRIHRKRVGVLALVSGVSTFLGLILFTWLKTFVKFNDGVNATVFVSFNEVINRNIPLLFEGFLSLVCNYNSNITFASLSGVLTAFCVIVSLLIFIVPVFVIINFIKKNRNEEYLFQIYLSFFVSILLGVCVFALIFTNAGINVIASGRYMMTALFFLLIVYPLFFISTINTFRKKILVVFLFLSISLMNFLLLNNNFTITKSSKDRLVSFLLSEKLEVGYGTYWNADALSVLSNYKLDINHINLDPILPDLFMSSLKQYENIDCDEYFLLLKESELNKVDFNELSYYLGDPIRQLEFEDFKIIVYGKAFWGNLPNWGGGNGIDISKIKLPTYMFGSQVSTKKGTDGKYFLLNGWSAQEEWGVWTDGHEASLGFKANFEKDKEYTIVLNIHGFVNEKNTNISVDVFVNDKKADEIEFSTVDNGPIRKIKIPNNFIDKQSDKCIINFKINNPITPFALGMGNDKRLLGIGLVGFSVETLQ